MTRVSLPRLSQRDKRAIFIGALVLALAILFFGWISPRLETIKRLDRAIASEAKRLEQVRGLYQAVMDLNEREARINDQIKKRTQEAFSVASVVEAMARESGLMEQVQYLKPEQGKVSEQFREMSVSLKMVEVSPSKFVDFLYRIESSDRVLRVRNLQIRLNAKESDKLDVSLTVSTLMPAWATPPKPTDGQAEGPEEMQTSPAVSPQGPPKGPNAKD